MAMERLRNMAVLERRYDTSMVGAGRVDCTVGTNSRGIYLELCCGVECVVLLAQPEFSTVL